MQLLVAECIPQWFPNFSLSETKLIKNETESVFFLIVSFKTLLFLLFKFLKIPQIKMDL